MTRLSHVLTLILVALGLSPNASAQSSRTISAKANDYAVLDPAKAEISVCGRLQIGAPRIHYAQRIDPAVRTRLRRALGPMPRQLFRIAPFDAGSLGRLYAVWMMNASVTTPDTGLSVWSPHFGVVLTTLSNGEIWMGQKKADGVPTLIVGEASQVTNKGSLQSVHQAGAIFVWSQKEKKYTEARCPDSIR
jgi:hypothetical protein